MKHIEGCYTQHNAKTTRNYAIHSEFKMGARKADLARKYGICNERVREIIRKIDRFIEWEQDQSAGAKEA